MDFTNAYQNIKLILNNKDQYMLYSYQRNQGKIETYLCNDGKNNITIYLIIRTNTSESLKSISIIEKEDGTYFFNAMWPKQSFSNIFNVIKNDNDNKTNEFFYNWINRLENITINNLEVQDRTNVTDLVQNVATTNRNNYADRNNQFDDAIYPNSIKHRARRTDGLLNNISENQKKKIIQTFGQSAFNVLQNSIFTLTFTSNPLKQKNINLMDLDKEES